MIDHILHIAVCIHTTSITLAWNRAHLHFLIYFSVTIADKVWLQRFQIWIVGKSMHGQASSGLHGQAVTSIQLSIQLSPRTSSVFVASDR